MCDPRCFFSSRRRHTRCSRDWSSDVCSSDLKITHRNVVRTYDLGEVNGVYYLTMEYVEGTSLKQLIGTRGRLPVPVVLTIGKQLCRALEVAHEQGVIHRDIKPQNIVVDPTGFLKVMDFGIARLATPATGKGLTQEGMSI